MQKVVEKSFKSFGKYKFKELAKGFLAKATITSDKEQIVFVLIHHKIGLVNVKKRYTRNTRLLMTQKNGWKLCDLLETKILSYFCCLWHLTSDSF